jgi:hypothetical protein
MKPDEPLSIDKTVEKTVSYAMASLEERGAKNLGPSLQDLRRIARAVVTKSSMSDVGFQSTLGRTASQLCAQGAREIRTGDDLLEAVRDAWDATTRADEIGVAWPKALAASREPFSPRTTKPPQKPQTPSR